MDEMKGPTFSEILDWLEGRLPEEERRRVAEMLANADEATQENEEWLQNFLQASRRMRFDSPPRSVRTELQRRFAASMQDRKPPGLIERLRATLAFDSHTQIATSGVRSAGMEGLQRQLVYRSGEVEVALNIQPGSPEAHINLYGQVFPLDGTPADTFIIQILKDSGEAGLTNTDNLGEFVFEDLLEGDYQLILASDRLEISIPSVSLHF